MSFTDEVVRELMDAPLTRTCCRKAMLYGLFINATVSGERMLEAEFKSEQSAQRAAEILKKQFSSEAELVCERKASRDVYKIVARSKALVSFLQEMDKDNNAKTLTELVDFKCSECAQAFVRGAFVSAGTVSDPQKGYHLEFSAVKQGRAKLLCDLLGEQMDFPKVIQRTNKIGIYYKKSQIIIDLLYYMGATKCNFDMMNACIERELRNDTNRSTNCVASNISKSVAASLKHVEAIERLKSTEKLAKLSEELRYTAALRVNNPSATLSELALMHEPPISKSGLNRRLAKILEEADSI